MSISRSYLLRRKKDLDLVAKKGRTVKNSFFFIKYLRSEGSLKFAVSISSKVAKKAVVRNGVKRRIKEAIRKSSLVGMPIMALIVPQASVMTMSFAQLQKELVSLLRTI